jgi:hypothetical protein
VQDVGAPGAQREVRPSDRPPGRRPERQGRQTQQVQGPVALVVGPAPPFGQGVAQFRPRRDQPVDARDGAGQLPHRAGRILGQSRDGRIQRGGCVEGGAGLAEPFQGQLPPPGLVEPAGAPRGGLDQPPLDLIGRLEAILVGFGQELVLGLDLGRANDRAGQPMLQGVGAGLRLPLGRLRPG